MTHPDLVQNHLDATTDAVSSLLLAAPNQELRVDQLEQRLSPIGRAYMREALEFLIREGSVELLDDTHYALSDG